MSRVGRRQEIDQAAHLQQRFDVVVEAPSAIEDLWCGPRRRPVLRRHRFVGDGLHHVRAGDEHVARVAHHEDEVGHGGRIDVAAGAGAHDDGDLRNDAGGQHVALEDLAIAAERATPSWMRAPPASKRPMIGARLRSAMSCSLVIFGHGLPTASRRTR
jgi:hypothetical protein